MGHPPAHRRRPLLLILFLSYLSKKKNTTHIRWIQQLPAPCMNTSGKAANLLLKLARLVALPVNKEGREGRKRQGGNQDKWISSNVPTAQIKSKAGRGGNMQHDPPAKKKQLNPTHATPQKKHKRRPYTKVVLPTPPSPT